MGLLYCRQESQKELQAENGCQCGVLVKLSRLGHVSTVLPVRLAEQLMHGVPYGNNMEDAVAWNKLSLSKEAEGRDSGKERIEHHQSLQCSS